MAPPKWQALALEAMRWRYANEHEKAINCLHQSIAITQESSDLAHETGTYLNYLADTLLQAERLEEAEKAIRRAMDVRTRSDGSESALVGDDLMILAKVLSQQGRHHEAWEAAVKGLAMKEKTLGKWNSHIRQIRKFVKQLKRNRGRAEVPARTPHVDVKP